MEIGGIRLIGLNGETAMRVLLTAAMLVAVYLFRTVAVFVLSRAGRTHGSTPTAGAASFWARQIVSIVCAAVIVIVALSIWFDSASRLATVAGFATAGLAIAAQRSVTALAGYLIIMRGNSFTIGDRIKMGGVHGDVIALGFLHTRILEMGQPPDVNAQEAPGMWVQARQFTGRIVTVTNDKIFDEAVYNFTRELPFIWEEIHVGVAYRDDRARAEQILREAADAETRRFQQMSDEARHQFEHRYRVTLDSNQPRVYWRVTDNWLELTVRFLVPEHEVRAVKDAITRRVLPALEAAGIGIASATFELSGLPPLRIHKSTEYARESSDTLQ